MKARKNRDPRLANMATRFACAAVSPSGAMSAPWASRVLYRSGFRDGMGHAEEFAVGDVGWLGDFMRRAAIEVAAAQLDLPEVCGHS